MIATDSKRRAVDGSKTRLDNRRKHSSFRQKTADMNQILIVLVFLLAAEGIRCSPTRRFEQFTFEKYLTKARAVLGRVPLIDGQVVRILN